MKNKNLVILGLTLCLGGLISTSITSCASPKAKFSIKYFKKQDGTYEILKVNGKVENLVIPEKHNGKPVTSIADNAVKEHRELKSLQLSNNLEMIGFKAFFGDSSLTSLTFPTSNAIPSLKIISSHAFGECYNLKDLYIPNGVHEIGSFAFQNNRAIKDLFIPWNVQKIESDAFNGCSNLTFYLERKEIPTSWSTKWNSSNRPYILDSTRDTPGTLTIKDGLMFRKTVDKAGDVRAEIVKFDETAGELSNPLKIPKEVEIGGVELKVCSINENAFGIKPKGNVRWIVIPGSIAYVGPNAFKALSDTIIFIEEEAEMEEWDENWANGTLKTYSDFTGFADREYGEQKLKLAYTDIGSGSKTILIDGTPDTTGAITTRANTDYVTEIAPKAFANRDDIKKIQTSGTNDELTLINDFAFANCYNLDTVTLEEGEIHDLTIGKYAFYTTLYNNDHNGAINITINGYDKVTIGESAFEKGYKTSGPICTEIQTLSISNVASIGQAAFKGCQFKEGCTVALNNNCTKPDKYCFNQSGENLTINVSSTLLNKMQTDWGWALNADPTKHKLGLYSVTGEDNTYQLYTPWGETKTYERFGQAHIVVS